MAFEYADNLPVEAKHRYYDKLSLLGQDICPYKVAGERWINDPLQWPAVEYHDIYNFLIKHPGIYSPEAMENYRSLDAHRFFMSGWVGTLTFITTSTGILIFRADVKPSWRVTSEPHHPWVAVRSSGPIAAAHCDCMAGLGETCSHVGAVLFKIEAAVRLGYTSSVCTDKPCAWNACFIKKVTAAPIRNIRFYKESAKKKISSLSAPKATDYATEAEQEQLVSALADLGSTKVVGLSCWKQYVPRFIGMGPAKQAPILPRPLSLLYRDSHSKLSPARLSTLCLSTFQKLTVSTEQVKNVESVTQAQSSSSVWYTQRCGRVTASVAAEALRTNPEKPAPSLIKKICSEKRNNLNVASIRWGREHEGDGYQLYDHLYTGSGPPPKVVPTGIVYMTNPGPHNSCKVSKSGLVISAEKPFLGGSPDGVVSCDCCGSGVIEIKSPFSLRESELKDEARGTLGLDQESYQLKTQHKYYTQVQMQMFACGVGYADLVIWTPIDCIITRVSRNESFISSMVVKLEQFWKCAVLPELLTRRLQQQELPCKENVPPSDDDEGLYCLCHGPAEGKMVGCDKCDEWYHLTCLGLKRLPTEKMWYCPQCKKKATTGKCPPAKKKCPLSRVQ